MDITKINHMSGVQGMLANIYNAPNQPQNVQSKESEQSSKGVDSINNEDRSIQSLQYMDITKRIEDKFSPSEELKKAREIGGELEGGFNDKTSFENLSSMLKKQGLITSNEQVAMDYLKTHAPKLDFDEFAKIAANDNHSKEMKGLIDSVIKTMEFVDDVNGGVLRGS
ncbi:hypothetical protein [Helicobacter marmotae]|uniref:Uncharacterized protein n=1 Tax=Helicobacter marmotae TaxID=152490 RepID=A0A3D8I614_9HELI|nr:hypothetical protein [Helicobacter marmotae]RDU60001.1 hypothetical protein CQA63_04410 [Helicobacter marmotae]